MARWIALAITLICFGSCSFVSQSVFRGMVAPVGVIVFSLITLFLFIQHRVAAVARPPAAAILDPETQLLMRKRALEKAAAEKSGNPASNSQRTPGIDS